MADNTTPTMTDSTPDDVGGRYGKMSAWPPFVAIGFAISEVGVVMNLPSLSVGGILLFGGSLAGILTDAGYVESPWPSMGLVGGLFSVFGGLIWASQLQTYTLSRLLAVAGENAIAMRGEAVLVAGILLVLGAIVGIVVKPLADTH
ncbi:MAG: cox cluster protein [Halanaeroarchaeum sp.]